MSTQAPGKGSKSTEVAIPDFSVDDLQNLKTFGDLDALLGKYGVDALPADQILGDGFAILKDGYKLVGVPLLILEWRFPQGDFGEFVAMRIVAKGQNGEALKYIYNDGSTGIYEQLRQLTNTRGMTKGLIVQRGFRVSEYEYEDPKTNVLRPAKTFYLDTSAA